MASPAPDPRSRWNNSTGGQTGNPDKTTVMIVRHSCINQFHHTASEFLHLGLVLYFHSRHCSLICAGILDCQNVNFCFFSSTKWVIFSLQQYMKFSCYNCTPVYHNEKHSWSNCFCKVSAIYIQEGVLLQYRHAYTSM